MKRLSLVLALFLILIPTVSVFAIDPLALPAYELVNFNAGELQMLGFAGGDVQATVGFYGSSSTPDPTVSGPAPWYLVPTVPTRIRNCATAIFANEGAIVMGTVNNQYSSNIANETEDAATFGQID